jgi:Fe-S-cluster containining protein
MPEKKKPWYIGGLHFECQQCGNCCAGPSEGFIWITKPEIEMLAEHLGLSVGKLREKYLVRLVTRTSIIEDPASRDCIFLSNINNGIRGCAVYPVRPNQCRTWPFWSSNLTSPSAWDSAALKCPGVNRGKLYTFEQINKLKKQKKWWEDEK